MGVHEKSQVPYIVQDFIQYQEKQKKLGARMEPPITGFPVSSKQTLWSGVTETGWKDHKVTVIMISTVIIIIIIIRNRKQVHTDNIVVS